MALAELASARQAVATGVVEEMRLRERLLSALAIPELGFQVGIVSKGFAWGHGFVWTFP